MNSSKPHYFGKWVNAPWPVPPTVCQLQGANWSPEIRRHLLCASVCIFGADSLRVRGMMTDRKANRKD